MPLPPPAPRQHLHTRAVTYQGYLREDGLWDIEGELRDTKAYDFAMMERGAIPAGTPIHGMSVRVTIDDQMKIHAISASMDDTPYTECRAGEDPMQRVVGATLGPGWRQAIEAALGNTKGCTHLRELLFNIATAAYQTVFPYQELQRRNAGVDSAQVTQPPYHLGRCIAWAYDGPVVARHYPQFVNFQPRPRKDKKAA